MTPAHDATPGNKEHDPASCSCCKKLAWMKSASRDSLYGAIMTAETEAANYKWKWENAEKTLAMIHGEEAKDRKERG